MAASGPLTLSIDAMGGDGAPLMVVNGIALAHQRLPDINFLVFGDDKYKYSMDWALEFYSRERWISQAFLPWTISAFVSLYEQSGDLKYSEYAFKLSDRLLKQQNLDTKDTVYGSFHGIPSANTGSYMEALGDAVHLAKLVKDQPRLKLSVSYTHLTLPTNRGCRSRWSPDH